MLTEAYLQQAIDQLKRSAEGRNALAHLVAWMDEGGVTLDVDNQEAVVTLLLGAWGEFSGTTCDMMRATQFRSRERPEPE